MTAGLSPLFSWRGAISSPESGLEPTSRHVALALSLHMNERGGSCFPSLDTLAAETGYHVDTVKKHLRVLATGGWITKVTRSMGVGRGSRNDYQATTPDGVVAPPSDPPDDPAERGPAPLLTGVVRPGDEGVMEGDKETDASRRSVTGARAECDVLFQAIVTACGMDYAEMTARQRKACGVAMSELRQVGATPEDVAHRAVVYRQMHTARLTPNALANQWAALREVPAAVAKPKDSAAMNGVRRALDGLRGEAPDNVVALPIKAVGA